MKGSRFLTEAFPVEIEQFGAVVLDAQYTAETELTVGVRRSEVNCFLTAFTNALGGRSAAEQVRDHNGT